MSSQGTEQLVTVPMPQMGTSIVEGEVIAWLKQPGDQVEYDETICEISTDKVDSECPAPVAGVLVEILVAAGEVAEVGVPLARIAPSGSVPGGSEQSVQAPEAAGSDQAEPPSAPAASEPKSVTAPSTNGDRRFYSPVARRVAAAHDVDLAQVTGSGANGRVSRRDVEKFVADREEPRLHSDSPYKPEPVAVRPGSAPPPSGDPVSSLGGNPAPLSRMRVAVGTAMRRSLDTAATCHTVIECDVTALERRRLELGVTALPIVARSVIEALRDFPDLNARLDEATITRFDPVHLGIAVSLGDDGLIVPVVKDAQDFSIAGLAARIKDLAKRARARELAPEEVQGATFTITNPGAFGASIATPVIDVPQVGILDMEAIVRRPVVVFDEAEGESIAIRSMVNFVLGWDHRAIDGVYAARFLSRVRDLVQS